jgi:hypothetical protein
VAFAPKLCLLRSEGRSWGWSPCVGYVLAEAILGGSDGVP